MKGCLVNSKQMLTWLEFDAQQKKVELWRIQWEERIENIAFNSTVKSNLKYCRAYTKKINSVIWQYIEEKPIW